MAREVEKDFGEFFNEEAFPSAVGRSFVMLLGLESTLSPPLHSFVRQIHIVELTNLWPTCTSSFTRLHPSPDVSAVANIPYRQFR